MDPVRAMSFNVRYDTANDGWDNWAHRRRLVAGTIRYHDPDVIGIQEAMAHQLREIDTLLDAYEWIGDARDSVADGGEYTAVGYRHDRFTAEAAETFWLSESPDEPGSIGWDAAHPRVATWVRLREHDTDESLLSMNTHLDHRGERARKRGVELVLQRLSELADDAVVVLNGDFNCVVGDRPHARADGFELPDGRRLRDARTLAARRHGPTTTTRTDFHELIPDMGIDHVFVPEGVDITGWAAVTDRDDDHYASDHLPVVVDCEP